MLQAIKLDQLDLTAIGKQKALPVSNPMPLAMDVTTKLKVNDSKQLA